MAKKIASVGNAAASAVVAAWIRASVRPTWAAKPTSARPSLRSVFHTGYAPASRYSMTNAPSSRDDPRHGVRRRRTGRAKPLVFIAVSLDRRLPELGHPQARQRALHAHRSAREIDAPDVRGHAAGE